MAEVKNDEEQHALPSKRKPVDSNPAGEDVADDPTKKQKPEEQKEIEEDLNEDKEEDDSDDDDDDDGEDEEEDEDEQSNGEAVIDRKGKGIMIEEPESDSDSDSSDYYETDSDDDSDLSDDPLAEVDLDNILPSRTRGHRTVQPAGVCISDQPPPPKGDDAGDA